MRPLFITLIAVFVAALAIDLLRRWTAKAPSTQPVASASSSQPRERPTPILPASAMPSPEEQLRLMQLLTPLSIDETGYGPVAVAVLRGDVDQIATLVADGADVSARGTTGWSAMDLAVQLNKPEVIAVLLKAGANPNARLPENDGTSLHLATACGRTPAVEALLAAGADPNASDTRGTTPIMLPSAMNHVNVVRLLIEAGAEVNRAAKGGYTPLMFAAKFDAPEAAKVLLDAGADPHARSDDGGTARVMAETIRDPRRRAAIYAVLEPRMVPDLVRMLQSPDRQARLQAADDLGWLGPVAMDAVPPLIAQTRDVDPMMRALAIRSLGRIDPHREDVVAALEYAARKDSDKDVRMMAVNYLAGFAKRAPAIVAALRDPDAEARASAVYQVGLVGPAARDAIPDLVAVLRGPDPQLRLVAALSLGRIGPPSTKQALDALVVALDDPDQDVQVHAASALRRIGVQSPEIVAKLSEMSQAREPLRQIGAAGALASFNQPMAWPILRRAMRHDLAPIRRLAAYTAGEVGPSSAVLAKELLALLDDDDVGVRQNAAYALVVNGRADVGLPVLASTLTDPDPLLRRYAAQLLERLGADAIPATAALSLATKDDDAETRDFASRALAKVSGHRD